MRYNGGGGSRTCKILFLTWQDSYISPPRSTVAAKAVWSYEDTKIVLEDDIGGISLVVSKFGGDMPHIPTLLRTR